MKVRCIRVTDAFGNPILDPNGHPAQADGWLTVGKVYHVLEVSLSSRGTWKYRILGDKEPTTPALHPISDFEIVSAKVSPTWVVHCEDNDYFELTPQAWAQLGFWEQFFDHDPRARRIFDEERRKIIADDP